MGVFVAWGGAVRPAQPFPGLGGNFRGFGVGLILVCGSEGKTNDHGLFVTVEVPIAAETVAPDFHGASSGL